MKIYDDEKLVATVNGDWKYHDTEFQQYIETLMIEGVPAFGGEPKSGPGGIIGDTIVTLVPGDEGFDEAFWDMVQTDYDVVLEGEDAGALKAPGIELIM